MTTTDLQDRINGRLQAGRRVPELPVHTFKDSGISVRLRKLSPMTSQEILAQCRREMADEEPQPPMFEHDYGKGKILEPNTGHEIYVRNHAAWEEKVNKLANERLFKLAALDAVEVTIGDVERAAILRTKRYLKIAAHVEWQDDPDLTAEENERYFYIRHIACGSAEDIQEFYLAIAVRSQPTEAAIEQHKHSFPGDVQGT